MPLFLLGLILVCFTVIYIIKSGKAVHFKGRGLNIIIFFLSLFSLLISLRLFANMGTYVDQAGTTPSVVCGGDFWNNMDWLRLAFLLVLPVLSGRNLTHKREN